MWIKKLSLALAVCVVSGGLLNAADDVKPSNAAGQAVFELRTYTANEGKMTDLHKRFRDHTMRLFEKHGMKNVGYWVPVDQPDTLVYIIEHKSPEAAKASWAAFKNDPDWKQVYKESHKNGVLVKQVKSQFLSPTDYSPAK